MCALVRIPGYQVSFKNCPKEFDIREMAARRVVYARVRRSHAIMGCADHSKFGWMHLLFRQGNLTIPISIRRFERIILSNDASKRVKYLEIHQRRYFSCQRKGKIFFLSPSIEARRHESRRFFLRSFRFFPLLVHGCSTVYRSSKPPLPCPTWWFRVWLVHSLAR